MQRHVVAVGLMLAVTCAADAHFSMLIPQAHSSKRGEPIVLTYQWGHPFEHQLFDAPAPERVRVILPDGQVRQLTKAVEKSQAGTAACHRVRFTPEMRGDYTFLLETPPIWMPEDKEFLQDTVKVVVHVQEQKGWHAEDGAPLQIVPMTRPYGLRAHMTFQARVLARSAGAAKISTAQPFAGTTVLFECYHAEPPASLPPDELMTFATRTDPNGIFTCSFPEPGWWCLAAQRDARRREYEGTEYPVRERVILWVFVGAS